MQFCASADIQVAMETKLRRKTKLACVQLFKFELVIYMLFNWY